MGGTMQPAINHKAEALPYAAVPVEGSMQEVIGALPQHWPALSAWLAAQGIAPAGAPFILYRRIAMPDHMAVEIGIPTAEPAAAEGEIVCGELPAGDYVEALYVGHYDGLMQATADLLQWGDKRNVDWDAEMQGAQQVWTTRLESYLTDPASEPNPDNWQTQLSIKIR